MNFQRKQKLDARRAVVNASIKRLDAGLRSLKKDSAFVTTRLTRNHGDCATQRSQMAAEKMGLSDINALSHTRFAYCGHIKKGWETLSSLTQVYWNPNQPDDRAVIVDAMRAQGLTVTNPDQASEAVVVVLEPQD